MGLPSFHCAVDLALSVLLCGVVTLVVELFAPCKRNLDLDETAAEINAQRDQRISVLLHLAVQPHDLTLVHEQPAGDSILCGLT